MSLPLLYLHNGLAFYRGNFSSVGWHQHHAVELVISEGPCEFWNESEPLHRGRVALLGADVPHRFVGNGWQWFIYLEPESRLGLAVTSLLPRSEVLSLPDEYAATLPVAAASSPAELLALFGQLVGVLLPQQADSPVPGLDERIERVVAFIKNSIEGPLSVSQCLDVANLSEGRLMHLFKEQVGIPIRRYILWTRLQVSVQHVLQGENLTRAAHSGGFADSAHFSRTFSDMFGIRPSDVLTK